MAKRAKTATVQLKLRMREELRGKLAKMARARDVSLNNEMVDRLEQSFTAAGVETLLELLDVPADDTRLLAMFAQLLRFNRGWKTDPEKRENIGLAVPLLLKFCVTAALTKDDIDEANHSKVVFNPDLAEGHMGSIHAQYVTGQITRDLLQKKD
jgi:Arc-like DNA binding domain